MRQYQAQATPETLLEVLSWAQLQTMHTLHEHYEDAALCEVMWTLSVEKEVVAYAVAVKLNDGTAFVHALETKRNKRGKGYGRDMAEHVIAALQANGATTIVLQPLLASVGFWEALGFQDDLDDDGMPLSGRMLLPLN
jgi:predicted GNAT family acetyltransferase